MRTQLVNVERHGYLDREILMYKESVLNHLGQWKEHKTSLQWLQEAQHVWDAWYSQPHPDYSLAPIVTDIPYVLGWAHARGWIDQPEIEALINVDGTNDLMRVRWENGRVDALASVANTIEQRESIALTNRAKDIDVLTMIEP